MVISRDPVRGIRNVGMYRVQVLGPQLLAMHWQRQFGSNPTIHLSKLVTAGMPRNMDVMIFHRQNTNAARSEIADKTRR